MRTIKGIDVLTFAERAQATAMTRVVRSSFAAFGRSTRIVFPCRLAGAERIAIGSECYIYRNCWLQTLPVPSEGFTSEIALVIGDRVTMSGSAVLSATTSVVIEDDVTLARGVFVSDHGHAREPEGLRISPDMPTPGRPVHVGTGAWLGQNAVVTPGVRVGAGAVIGANSVVTRDVPNGATAVGAPARVVSTADDAVRTS